MNKFLLLINYFTFVNLVVTLNIECEYGLFDSRHAYGDKYRCLVINNIDIILPEEAEMKSITGTHQSGKTNDSDIHFHISSKSVQHFPRGMEKFYKNLKGIVIWHTKLKEIHQEDLKAYPNLDNLYLSGNDIEIIEDGLFDFNPVIEVIIFENTKLIHIGPTVFNHLSKLRTLFFNGNLCTNLSSFDNRAVTLNVIRGIRSSCISPDYVNLRGKLENFEEVSGNSLILSSQQFSQDVLSFQREFKNSKFANFPPLKQKFQQLIKETIRSSKGDQCSSESNKIDNLKRKIEKDLEDSQQNILKAVDAKIEDFESRMTRKIEEILDEKLEKVMTNIRKIITML